MKCSVNDNDICGGQTTASIYQAVGSAALQSDQSGGNRKQKGKMLSLCKEQVREEVLCVMKTGG
jgi:hypothetical protein